MEMEGSPSEFRDWAHLPVEIVEVISEKVKSITDYVRFRAVCSPWRSASLSQPRHLPPQLPWLMIPYMPNPERFPPDKKDDGIRLFYDHWESKMRKLHLPETIGMMCCANYRGWLLLVAPEGKEVFLLNPLTRVRVQLPPFTLPVKRLRDRGGSGAPHPANDVSRLFKPPMGNFVITRVTFSAVLTDPNCLIMVFLEDSRGIFYCRVGDPCWSMVHIGHSDAPWGDATYYNGCFYLLYQGAVYVIDLDKSERSKVCLFEKLRDVNFSVLEGKSGVHVVAVHNSDIKEVTEKTLEQRFELYQFLESKLDLKKITDTSNTTLFFGENHHFLAVCSDDWDLLDGGCVYMEHKCKPSAGKDQDSEFYNYYYSISFAKMDDVNFKTVVCDIAGEPPIWLPPPAMWFQPSYV
ncbi:hypothetical protein LUZ61_022562 [Rhynchospora tenuis]|uniref:KIB1-4 beta-propeller domain-containing protein n=1 Tax=Rhynchospora tenuis TaxID=198213 RepID=A0AAD5Z0X8_9POAL|nr:hypothetical protein LUZ61_022872 [Rhynchospora tenuis]KAJ3670565.1 hypothetical protein LUZ61_022562 [Rhynchospora tenuis]